MNGMAAAAVLANAIIVIGAGYALWHIRRKREIWKYYTYLQNLLALIASLVFLAFAAVRSVSGAQIPEFVKGLRYVTASGLLAAMLIFVVFLKKNPITKEDLLDGLSPEWANAILHYICPLVSLSSFLIFEKDISLENGVWTGIAALPSCVYWVAYAVLSGAKLWNEPYPFLPPKKKNGLADHLTFAAIPLVFIAITYILWNLQQLSE